MTKNSTPQGIFPTEKFFSASGRIDFLSLKTINKIVLKNGDFYVNAFQNSQKKRSIKHFGPCSEDDWLQCLGNIDKMAKRYCQIEKNYSIPSRILKNSKGSEKGSCTLMQSAPTKPPTLV